MIEPVPSPYLVENPESFRVADVPTAPPDSHFKDGKKKAKNQAKERLEELVEELSDLQRRLYASDDHAILLVFQAMDAAGKDSTIRAVTSGINPAGFQVSSFKKPSSNELDHDFLWRTSRRLPQRGRIGIFNRSYYEETLIVRVHPKLLDYQRLPERAPLDRLWDERFESIRDHERHLARNGTRILKFWLNVSRDEQRARFLDRIDTPRKNWKFAAGDVRERGHWEAYQAAYEATIRATSTPWAPWYAIPADDKPYMRMTVATIFRDTLRSLDLRYPELPESERAQMAEYRAQLVDD